MASASASALSVVSKKYDVENKGYLSKEQQALRNLDKEGKGHLSAEQLAPLMEEYKKLSKDNAQNRRLIIALFVAVVVLGAGTIAASILAVRSSKDTRITSDGTLAKKGTDQPVITTSQGFSVSTNEKVDPKTGNFIQCLSLSQISRLYISYSKGTQTLLHVNNTLSTDNSIDAGRYSFPVLSIRGDSAMYNDTHVSIGNAMIDISPENPCMTALEGEAYQRNAPDRIRNLFQRHLAITQEQRILSPYLPCDSIDDDPLCQHVGTFSVSLDLSDSSS
uniref:EF-hand domain-containing protein n=1 Tax=Helicotheca tamesis TaxID=374047 RepID=A0A7S2HHR9_9STRA|mmetsp:Transcript_18201/g.25050  ORF Transcript_18201/g.25050 Transcript_18201/m.25050 type:complete len:277 (+) Transcript_18201:40-870(+)|eukprot:CAMPEP_0185736766 /NCGR_PEP_ID=MMETSP1171-20130828/28733_1 /TAXON_ID=374046 /ORGANISM="Helicotheca tamensis, Strain CCMP826" /LENGTH=276 /DNA_ID=CAMNT_0028407485 /DNA_START=29 /DNA_END=859 /DNA_ORIENTATION=+